MKKHFLFISLVFFSFSISRAQLNISGTVINQTDFPVDSLEVSLKKLGVKTLTDKDGEFEFIVTGLQLNKLDIIPQVHFDGRRFIIPINSSAQHVSIDIFNVKGVKVATLLNRTLAKGDHSVQFNSSNPLAASMLIALIRTGSSMTKMQLVKTGTHTYFAKKSQVKNTEDLQQPLAQHPEPLDSLIFTRRIVVEGVQKVIREFSFPIIKKKDRFAVTLDMIPYEAVEWGKTQEGRSNETVGKELGKPGNGTYPYEFQTYYNGAWCSEFYCYAMRIAGYPLGNDNGSATRPNWLLLGHNSLERWFDNPNNKKAEFIKKSEIEPKKFIPVPGDFIHMDAHTTMVRYIAENGDCYCLDGNWGDKVKLINRGNYKSLPKNCKTLHGYGRRSGVVKDSYKSISD